MSRFVTVLALVFCLGALARAEPVTPAKPVAAEVYVKPDAQPDAKPDARATRVSGTLLNYDDEVFTLRVGKDEQKIAWRDVTPASAFTLRQKLIDRSKADEWLALGKFAWSIGAKEQAQGALRTAVKMDAALKPQADEVLASKPADAVDKSADKSTGAAPAGGAESAPVAQPGRKKGEKVERLKYVAATPEEAAAAMKRNREASAQVQKELNVTFVEIETDHFLIFTDWDPREHAFLKKNLEEAYRVVSKQFDVTPKENIFVGKLPVYMFNKLRDFQKFAKKFDGFPTEPDSKVAGYYHGNDQGIGHMAMWKPDGSLTEGTGLQPERLWGYVLVHEFTHAFIARYRSNEFIPRWLNEGIAEVIASSEIQLPNRHAMARDAAIQGADISFLFDDSNMPDGRWYPVMQTLVEMLVKADRKQFIKYVDSIKDGTDPEEALKTIFKTDYNGLTKAWRDYAKKLAN